MSFFNGPASLDLEIIQRVGQSIAEGIQVCGSHKSTGYPLLQDVVEEARV